MIVHAQRIWYDVWRTHSMTATDFSREVVIVLRRCMVTPSVAIVRWQVRNTQVKLNTEALLC